MRPEIFDINVIKPGVLKRDRFGNILDARSTVTLMTMGKLRIIVDTGLTEEKQLILDTLLKLNLKTTDIDMLINTHSHIDHSGNNDLFPNARFVGHRKEFWGVIAQDNCVMLRKDTEIISGLKIMETPGHTAGSITILVHGSFEGSKIHKVAIAGDALPIMDNFLKWVPPRIHIDPKIALWSMKKIIEHSEVIIPGHDKPFIILDREKKMAKYL